MDTINLSINPSYLCNFRCGFCYLSPAQLSDSKRVSPNTLFNQLEQIAQHRRLNHVDFYGGEIGCLDDEYTIELLAVIRFFYSDKINVITNLSKTKSFFLKPDIDLSVSWDYFAREKWELVYNNMMKLEKPFHMLILASHELVKMTDLEFGKMIEMINAIPYLQTVEIKPYSKNTSNNHPVTFLSFENWIKRWLASSSIFKFKFINEDKIRDSLGKTYSAWSDNHLYINPNGNLAVLEFDADDKEYFLELDNFLDYEEWCLSEKKKVTENSFCSKCDYMGNCLSEHLQVVKNLDQSCNGFYGLLKWYANAKL